MLWRKRYRKLLRIFKAATLKKDIPYATLYRHVKNWSAEQSSGTI